MARGEGSWIGVSQEEATDAAEETLRAEASARARGVCHERGSCFYCGATSHTTADCPNGLEKTWLEMV